MGKHKYEYTKWQMSTLPNIFKKSCESMLTGKNKTASTHLFTTI